MTEQLKEKGIWIDPLNHHTFRERQGEFNWCVYDKKDIAKAVEFLKGKIKDEKVLKLIDEAFEDVIEKR